MFWSNSVRVLLYDDSESGFKAMLGKFTYFSYSLFLSLSNLISSLQVREREEKEEPKKKLSYQEAFFM